MNTVTWLPVTGDSQHPTSATLAKILPKGPGDKLSQVRQNMFRLLWHTSKISQNFAGDWKFGLWCYGRTGRKTHWFPPALAQLSRGIFSLKHLAYTFRGRLRREMSRYNFFHSLLSPFLCMGMITSVCQSFIVPPEYHLTHMSKPKTCSSVQGCKHSRSHFIE